MAAVKTSPAFLLGMDDGAGLQQLSEGIREEMMVAMLNAMQGTAAVCADICVQRLKSLHEQMLREYRAVEEQTKVEVEVDTAEHQDGMDADDGGAALEAMYDDLDVKIQGKAVAEESVAAEPADMLAQAAEICMLHLQESVAAEPADVPAQAAAKASEPVQDDEVKQAPVVVEPEEAPVQAAVEAVEPVQDYQVEQAPVVVEPAEAPAQAAAEVSEPVECNGVDQSPALVEPADAPAKAAAEATEPERGDEVKLAREPVPGINMPASAETSEHGQAAEAEAVQADVDAVAESLEATLRADEDVVAESLNADWPNEPMTSAEATSPQPSSERAPQESDPTAVVKVCEAGATSAEVESLEDALDVDWPKEPCVTAEGLQATVMPSPQKIDERTDPRAKDDEVTPSVDIDPEGATSAEDAALQPSAGVAPEKSDPVTASITNEAKETSEQLAGSKDASDVDCPEEPSATAEHAALQPPLMPNLGAMPSADVDLLAVASSSDLQNDSVTSAEVAVPQPLAEEASQECDLLTCSFTNETEVTLAKVDGLEVLDVDWPKEPSVTAEVAALQPPAMQNPGSEIVDLKTSDAEVTPFSDVDALAEALDVDWPNEPAASAEATAPQSLAEEAPKETAPELIVTTPAEADSLKGAVAIDSSNEPGAKDQAASSQPPVTLCATVSDEPADLTSSFAEVTPCADMDGLPEALDVDWPQEPTQLAEAAAAQPSGEVAPKQSDLMTPSTADDLVATTAGVDGLEDALDVDWPQETSTAAEAVALQPSEVLSSKESEPTPELGQNDAGVKPCANVHSPKDAADIDWPILSAASTEAATSQPSAEEGPKEPDPVTTSTTNEAEVTLAGGDGLEDAFDVDWPREPAATVEAAEVLPSPGNESADLGTSDAKAIPCADADALAEALDVDWPNEPHASAEGATLVPSAEEAPQECNSLPSPIEKDVGLTPADVAGLEDAIGVEGKGPTTAVQVEDLGAASAPQPSAASNPGESNPLESTGANDICGKPSPNLEKSVDVLDVDCLDVTADAVAAAAVLPASPAELTLGGVDALESLGGDLATVTDAVFNSFDDDWPQKSTPAAGATIQTSAEPTADQVDLLATEPACEEAVASSQPAAALSTEESDTLVTVTASDACVIDSTEADALADALDIDWSGEAATMAEVVAPQAVAEPIPKEVPDDAWDFDWEEEPDTAKLAPVVAGTTATETPSATEATEEAKEVPEDAWDFDWADEAEAAAPTVPVAAKPDGPAPTVIAVESAATSAAVTAPLSADDPWDDLDIDFSEPAGGSAAPQGNSAPVAAQPAPAAAEDPFAEFAMPDLTASPLASSNAPARRSAAEEPRPSKSNIDDLDPFAEFTL